MSATKAILAVCFLSFVSITLFFPLFPPASLMHNYESIFQTTLYIGEISVTTLLNGIINGLFWGLFAAVTYGLAQLAFPARMPPLAPMSFAPDLNMPLLENRLVDSYQNIIPPHLTVSPSKQPSSKRKKHSKRSVRTKSVPAKVSRTRTKAKTHRG